MCGEFLATSQRGNALVVAQVSVCGNRTLSMLHDGLVEVALVTSTMLVEEGGDGSRFKVAVPAEERWQGRQFPLATSTRVFPQVRSLCHIVFGLGSGS
jgi:hypothetical protein